MSRSPLILDGGMSRELIRLGAPFRQPEWSALALLEAPDAVQQAHSEFAAAGADILTTNSYALVPFHIGAERFMKQGASLAKLAGRLARKAADEEMMKSGRKVLIAGSLPPIFEEENVQKYLSILVGALSPYVDIWLGETLSLIAEGKAVETAVEGTGKPLWIAFTLDDSGDTWRTPCLRSGETVTEAVRWVSDSAADGILFNCSQPEFMTAAIRDTQAVFHQRGCAMPIGVYANAFEPKLSTQAANMGLSSIRSELHSQSYASLAREWVEEGVSIVGGCCGIGCEHIQSLAQAFRNDMK